jgi:hypothetical protein
MRLKRPLILVAGSLLVAFLLVVCFAPLIVANGLRIWAERAARREGMRLEVEQVQAPLLRPVVVRKLRFTNDAAAPFHIDCAASRLEFDLNLVGLLTGSGRPLRAITVEGLTLDIRQIPSAANPSYRLPWSVFENLLADNFKLIGVQLHIENGSTILDLRDGTLTGSQLETGIFTARELKVASPWFHKTLADLRGATSWQESRLVVGALSLMRGLDLDTITFDLAKIGESRIGMEMNFDAFGGKLRARFSSDDRGGKRTWDVAGNGSGISLAQMSDALEWTNRASGSLHASKFTFRGEINDLRNATASLWAEVSGLTWRDRTADTVMVGAALYNREVQVEQVYLKQRNNQLTLSGEFAWPEKPADWIKPAFHGDISAAINDLGDFARLFGWSPPDFAGKLVANGNVSAHEGKLGGQLSVSGQSLVLFRAPIASVEVKLGLEESKLAITQFEIRQQDDFFRAEGNVALTGDRAYTATVQTSVADIANYAGFIPWRFLPLGGTLAGEWTGRGANGNDSGTWHARGRNLRVVNEVLVPFEAELEADYSPDNIFFKQFHLWNQRADLSGFLTVGKEYVQAQELRFSLNGRPRLQGNVFLPVSVEKIRQTSRWLATLSSDPFFDVDLTLDTIDLAELAAAVKTKPDMAGQANARIQFSGTPASLQGKTEFHLRDFVLDGAPGLTTDLETRLALGMANFKANAIARGSDPARVEGVLPLQLEKFETGYGLKMDGPVSVTLNFSAIFLAKLPGYISRGIFTRGIVSGNLSVSDSLQHPLITGDASLIDGQFLRGPTLSTGVTFKGRNAVIDFTHLKENGADISARGEIDFRDLGAIELKLAPSVALIESGGLEPGDCVRTLELSGAALGTLPSRTVREIGFTGSIFARTAAISFPSPNGVDAPEVFPFCFGETSRGKTLTLQIAPSLSP